MRLIGLGPCPPLLLTFSTFGIFYVVRSKSSLGPGLGNKTLIIASLVLATALVAAQYWAIVLEMRSKNVEPTEKV